MVGAVFVVVLTAAAAAALFRETFHLGSRVLKSSLLLERILNTGLAGCDNVDHRQENQSMPFFVYWNFM